MQNRRNQDEGGLDGPNEVNTFDNSKGIRVNARYYMQIFNTKLGKSLQRDQQIALQEPPQQFFAFNFSLEPPAQEASSENNTTGNNTTGNNTNSNGNSADNSTDNNSTNLKNNTENNNN